VERDSAHRPVREVLRAGLAELELSGSLLGPLETLAELLARWAARLNLTAHHSPAAIAQRLCLDAIALGEALPAEPDSIADLGSGAGFPGLPLAIRWPDSAVTLVEARERRHHFQRTAIRELGLANVTPRLGRAESLDATPHRLVVAQAAAAPEIAIGWMLRWADPSSFLVLPQTDDPAPFELPPGVFHVETRSYQVPGGGPRRSVWIGRLGQP
jgi:16S rRNA (guanine527-N7)-methyltransferase